MARHPRLRSTVRCSENQAFHIFDALILLEARGVEKQDMIECVGVCQRHLVYENVTLSTAAVGNQTAEPAASITFSRPNYKAAVAEVEKTVVRIKRNGQSTAPNK
jgi:hypothetical protein